MITLASDFGAHYPGAMRGVLAAESDARILDVTHELPRQDVRAGAFWLRELLVSFPPAVHCAVVDPGVGTDRRALVVEAGPHRLVGPDNGLLLPAARRLADDASIACYEWAIESPASNTFHGRDVFAPCAAAVHDHAPGALESHERLTPVSDPVALSFPEPTIEAGRDPRGVVLVVDGFGNVITNLPGALLADRAGQAISVNGRAATVVEAYAEADSGAPVVTVGSHGNVECAVTEGRGTDAFGLAPGDAVRLSR
jgi:S-adenosylmethionine hydrolase